MANSHRDYTNEVYRGSTVGLCLETALQRLSKPLDPNVIEKVRSQFDTDMKEHVPPNGPIMKINASRIQCYKFIEHTWVFNLDNVNVRRQRAVGRGDKVILNARNHPQFHSKAKRQKKKEDPDGL